MKKAGWKVPDWWWWGQSSTERMFYYYEELREALWMRQMDEL